MVIDDYFGTYVDGVLLANGAPVPIGEWYWVSYVITKNGFGGYSANYSGFGSIEEVDVSSVHQYTDCGHYFSNKSDTENFIVSCKQFHEKHIIQLLKNNITKARKVIKNRKLNIRPSTDRGLLDIESVLDNILESL